MATTFDKQEKRQFPHRKSLKRDLDTRWQKSCLHKYVVVNCNNFDFGRDCIRGRKKKSNEQLIY